MFQIERLGAIAVAALTAGSLLGGPARAQQPGQTGAGAGSTATPASKPQANGACRVTDYVGGRTCTGDVPEGVCAAIAREAKGQYTWTQEECP